MVHPFHSAKSSAVHPFHSFVHPFHPDSRACTSVHEPRCANARSDGAKGFGSVQKDVKALEMIAPEAPNAVGLAAAGANGATAAVAPNAKRGEENVAGLAEAEANAAPAGEAGGNITSLEEAKPPVAAGVVRSAAAEAREDGIAKAGAGAAPAPNEKPPDVAAAVESALAGAAAPNNPKFAATRRCVRATAPRRTLTLTRGIL